MYSSIGSSISDTVHGYWIIYHREGDIRGDSEELSLQNLYCANYNSVQFSIYHLKAVDNDD